VSTAIIGVPSFVLALEPNRELVRGRFLTNVLARSMPASVAIAVGLFVTLLVERGLGGTFEEVSTCCMLLTAAVGIMLIYRIAQPLNPLRTALLDFIHRRIDAFGLRDFLVSQQLNYPQPLYYSLMNLLGSHDVERLMTMMAVPIKVKDLPREQQLAMERQPLDYALATAREKLCAAVQFALPGVPSVYYGDEQGMIGGGDPFNRRPFREGDAALHDYYAELSRRRNENPALSTGAAAFEAASMTCPSPSRAMA
jgi:hypothetical protein